MKITDDIEKSNFNPQMFKSCTDTSYQCGYEQGRNDAIDEFAKNLLKYTLETYAGGIEPIRFVTDIGIKNMAKQMKECSNMKDSCNNTECKCEEATDYDCISKSRLVRQILKIEDIQISPRTLNRILELIQNQVPYNEVDYNEQ